jgi:predicted RND superfamily exporter protein
MRVGVDALDYIDPSLAIHRDMTFFRTHVSGLNVARVWIRLPKPTATEPGVLLGLDRFASAIERVPDVASVVGPTSFLRLRRYLAGQPEALPPDIESFASATADIEQLLLTEAELRAFLDVNTLQHAQLTVIFNHGDEAAFRTLTAALRAAWERTVEQTPALEGAQMAVVGEALLQAKVGGSLVPTVAESFLLTATLIFVVFLFVFRSARARLMAMLPSVFAILGTFLGMRLFGASLNVATILIATMVLGTTENDQIHFFYHLAEAEGEGLEAALRHALRVSGRAIVFATLINAGGFLALSMSSFPPVRQLGLVTAAAFGLALVADFTALPAALWIGAAASPSRRPDSPRALPSDR